MNGAQRCIWTNWSYRPTLQGPRLLQAGADFSISSCFAPPIGAFGPLYTVPSPIPGVVNIGVINNRAKAPTSHWWTEHSLTNSPHHQYGLKSLFIIASFLLRSVIINQNSCLQASLIPNLCIRFFVFAAAIFTSFS